MNEKEELEWLRREKDSDMRFKASVSRGFLLGFIVGMIYSRLLPSDTVETRGALILIVIIAFATGALTAHVGKFRVEYQRRRK